MLAIEVEYLMGRAYAADFRDETAPEWPPHPDRLFEALVAAHHDTFSQEGEAEVLRWFETLGAPHIAAGEAGKPTKVVNFVPTNYDGKSRSPLPEQRGKQPRVFPVQSPASPVVHFVWPEAQPDETTRERLSDLLARVPALGRACSLVRVRLGDSINTPNYSPDPGGSEVLRVFGTGRLDELEALYELGQRPSLGPQMRYGRASVETVLPETTFGETIILRREEGRGLPIEAALTLTSALRKALMSLSAHDAELCAFFSGHGESHCAFAALPFVGHQYADGRLMGAAVILPRRITGAQRRRILKVCVEIGDLNVRDISAFWKVELCGFDVQQKTLQPEAWTRPSQVWASVTPVLLDRFPKKSLPVEEILAASCEKVGLPRPIEIEHGPFSSVDGVSPVSDFRLLRSKDEKPRWGVHARLRFAMPVRGPVLLGAGRFFGLGLMRPWRWKQEEAG